jgi:pilus assembly protein Flp/PilA
MFPADQLKTHHGVPVRFPGTARNIQSLEKKMNHLLYQFYAKFQALKDQEEGQDLVEYALVVALVAFGATAGMSALAGGINTAFGQISTTLGANITTIVL